MARSSPALRSASAFEPVDDSEARTFLRRALTLAERGWGRVHPNPMVGAVVVRDGEIVGEGWHVEYGGPHAEVMALEAAGEAARGATLYLTLEPCAHHGKTPPCTDAILRAGIARVVFAASDPNPKARGGADVLRAAGVEAIGGIELDGARALNAGFFHVHERRTAFVALKLAMSLDARISRSPDTSTRITGDEAAAEVQHVRAGFDAILVGSGTALADDPLLTVRGETVPRVPPIRIVADPSLRLSANSRLLETVDEAPVWLLAGEDAPRERELALMEKGARILRVPAAEPGIDLPAALDTLWAEGVRTVLCEGGGRLGSSLLAADRVARLILFVAPVLLGPDAVPAFPGGPDGALDDPARWRLAGSASLGRDVLAVWDRAYDPVR